MRREIIFPTGTWSGLRSHLLGQGPEEQLAFLLAGTARGRGWMRLLVREILLVPPDAFDRQSATYLAVKPAYSQAILRRCYQEALSLVEVHSHPFAGRKVTFSTTDQANDAVKFRYVAHKIPHVNHATMVVGQRDLDAHLWDRRRRRAVPVDRVRLLGAPIVDLYPTSSLTAVDEDGVPMPWLNRQVLAFGEEGQRRLQAVRVGVVGCGGTGSAVVQMLAHLGVRDLVLVDPDVVELTNLNRLVGATRADARRSRPKVRVAQRLVKQVHPEARVRALPLSVGNPEAIAALKGVDLLFGCTDNHGSRLILNQMAVQYLVPYLDLGAGLQATDHGRLSAAGGQVRLVRPGDFCLACIDGIDRGQAARDLMSPIERRREAARGYVQEDEAPTPAVLFLNAELASQAMAEFVNLWTGFRASVPLLYFDLLKSRLTSVKAERQGGCVACGEGGALSLGDLEPLPGVGSVQLPDSVPVLARKASAGSGTVAGTQVR
jgi:molybdopterin/thiamine biosynthesis adenylyltransferase